MQTCQNWQTLTVYYNWFLHVKLTHRNKFAYLVFIIFAHVPSCLNIQFSTNILLKMIIMNFWCKKASNYFLFTWCYNWLHVNNFQFFTRHPTLETGAKWLVSLSENGFDGSLDANTSQCLQIMGSCIMWTAAY